MLQTKKVRIFYGVRLQFSVYNLGFFGLFIAAEGFPGGSASKESACNAGNLGSIPGLGRSPGEGNGYPLQYSGLENSMDCVVHGLAKSQTRLSDFHYDFFIAAINSIPIKAMG